MRSASLGSSMPSVTEMPFIGSYRSGGASEPIRILSPTIEPGMHDLVPPLGRRLPLHWRASIRHQRDDLAAETPLIELERNLAITVEGQIRAQLHGVLLWCSRIERKVLAVTVSWRAFSSRLRSHPILARQSRGRPNSTHGTG